MIKLDFNKDLTNFQIQNICNQVGIKLNGIYMRNECPKTLANGNYIFNLESASKSGSHWVYFIKLKIIFIGLIVSAVLQCKMN